MPGPIYTIYSVIVGGLDIPDTGIRNLYARIVDERTDSAETRNAILAELATQIGLPKLPRRTQIQVHGVAPREFCGESEVHLSHPLPKGRVRMTFRLKTPEDKAQCLAFETLLDQEMDEVNDFLDGNDIAPTTFRLFFFTTDPPALKTRLTTLAAQHPLPPHKLTP